MAGASPGPLDQAVEAYRAGKMVEARTLSEPLAKAGDPKAATLVGFLYEEGLGGAKDETRAAAYYRTAAAQNDVDAMVALGRLGIDGKGLVTPTEARSFLSRAAEANRMDAASLLGRGILAGKLGKSDAPVAANWLRRAADSGDAEAAYALAIMEMNGDGIPENDVRGLLDLKRAADKDHPAAMADYGLLVYQGKAGKPPSTSDAAIWFERSAKAGDPEGQFLYAYSLAKGEGVGRDPIKAYVWLLRSNAQGSSGAPEYDSDRAKLKGALEKLLRPDEIAKAAAEAQKPSV
ncbi:MAG: tetratricopeptide repeat protein [Caulobacterales bacterium]